jgi:hypothetical protein
MLDACFREFFLIVLWFVKSDNKAHSHFLKNGYVIIRGERAILVCDI